MKPVWSEFMKGKERMITFKAEEMRKLHNLD